MVMRAALGTVGRFDDAEECGEIASIDLGGVELGADTELHNVRPSGNRNKAWPQSIFFEVKLSPTRSAISAVPLVR